MVVMVFLSQHVLSNKNFAFGVNAKSSLFSNSSANRKAGNAATDRSKADICCADGN